MTCTPEEARNKTCPWLTEAAWNDPDARGVQPCQAIGCMAWIEEHEAIFGGIGKKTGRGYCGRIGR